MLLFKFFVCFTFFFAATVIFSSTPFYSILGLICIIFNGCFILFLLRVEFLAFIMLLLYIGAIAVLFLFVVMMLQTSTEHSRKLTISYLSSSGILYSVGCIKLFYFLFYFNGQLSTAIGLFSYQFLNYSSVVNYTTMNSLWIAGDSVIFLSIFTQKYFLFILISIVLLFAMVGSIVLCIQEKK